MTMIDHAPPLSTTELSAWLSAHELLKSENTALKQHLVALQRRVEWFERQFFGAKSERRIVEDGAYQMSLGEIFDVTVDTGVPETKTIAAHKRQIPRKSPLDGAVCDTGLRFGPQVPVEEIRLEPAEIAGLSPDAYEIIDEKVTHKLAQEAASYVVIKIIQPVVKLKDSGALVSAPAPPAVLEKSYADVSFIAGMAVDKFLYHQPLYRQHQKLERNGIVLARGTLTTTMQRAIGLLEPIYTAVFCSVLQSLILAMDETPAKAGRAGGKMKTGYFWPIYGDQDEVVFPFFDNRRHENVDKLLKNYAGTLISDGYAAYERFAAKQNSPGEPGKAPVIHAHCWVHLRRMFLKAEKEHPERVKRALEFIRVLYRHDEARQDDPPEVRHAARQHHSAPVVAAFFAWLEQEQFARGLLPGDQFTRAMNYALQHRASFEVFLTQPNVALDTNHVERALRVIPMGRKNWNFCWTELGAKHVGIIQSLLVTCSLHEVNAYDYLVDVLQRVGQHPASRVHELTPRLWKQHFAADPLRSPLHRVRNPRG